MSKNNIVALSTIGTIVTIVVATIVFRLLGSESKLLADDAGKVAIALGRFAGLMLALLIFAQLLLASRMPALDTFPRASAFGLHRTLGFAVLWVLVAHVGLLVYGYAAQSSNSLFGQFTSFIWNWENVGYALVGALVIIAIGVISMRAVRSLFRYEIWYALHLFLYGATLFAFMHQITSGDMARGGARVFWIVLTALVFGVFFRYRVVRPLWYFVRHDFRVARVVAESPSVTSVYITGKNIETFRFKAGQYAHFTFLQKGLSTHHPFSFSQAYNGKELRISVKKLGDFTADLESLREGTRVIIDGPMGHFTQEVAETGKYCLIAGGIGITPIVALAQTLASPQDAIAFVLTRSRADAALIADLAVTGVQLRSYFAEDTPGQSVTAQEIVRACPDLRSRDIYLCGPPGMVTVFTAVFVEAGIPTAHIHYELFAY